MPDSRESLIEAVKARLREIDEKLDPYNALIEERSELLRVLRRHQPTDHRSQITFDRTTNMLHFPPLTDSTNIKLDTVTQADGDKTNHKATATSTVIREARHLLDGTKSKRMAFSKLLKLLPPSARNAFTGKYQYSAIKTAIQRAGHKAGIEYKKGGTVKIMQSQEEHA